MAYSKSYIGDSKALAVITQTIEKKNALIPGVTVKAELSGLVQANNAEYYYDLAPAVEAVAAGADFGNSNVGSKKAILVLDKALQIDEKIPNVAVDAISADVIYDKILKGSIALANGLGAKFITAIEALAQAKTYTKDADFYTAIVEAIGTFSSGVSVKVGGEADITYLNKTNGIQPTTILVGDVGRGKLYKTEAFQRTINATGAINEIGEMLGLKVIYVQDLSAAIDFVMLNHEGVAYPFSVNTLRVVESENFNGVRVQGEVVYPTQSYAILPIDSFAMKFTMALT